MARIIYLKTTLVSTIIYNWVLTTKQSVMVQLVAASKIKELADLHLVIVHLIASLPIKLWTDWQPLITQPVACSLIRVFVEVQCVIWLDTAV